MNETAALHMWHLQGGAMSGWQGKARELASQATEDAPGRPQRRMQ